MRIGFQRLSVDHRVNHLSYKLEIISISSELFEIPVHPRFKGADPMPSWSAHSLNYPVILKCNNDCCQRVEVAERVRFLIIIFQASQLSFF